ncbi:MULTISPECIES: anticodon nuclease [unclassified Moraxella]|uniref:anticodon nuclease n=1 Tax=unclassified Moraxella TaxID=2685852 RepID=UPI00359F0A49
MGKTLNEIAQELKASSKKSQLIYAFNGTGKTRLSREFKELISPKSQEGDEHIGDLEYKKILYYSSFTEDLFYWDNDLENDAQIKLKIHPNSFTNWVFMEQGLELKVTENFQRYTNARLTPNFNQQYEIKDGNGRRVVIPAFSEVTFSYETGDDTPKNHIKISKGEESNFIWSIFSTLIEEVIQIRNQVEHRQTNKFDSIEYIFIDDPVSSLDENHLIELAVNLAKLIKSSDFNNNKIKFIITTHSSIFYNILYNELSLTEGFLLEKYEDESFSLNKKQGDSNSAFSYHIHLKQTLETAISNNMIEKYHFTLLRNLYEKTASFLGYKNWSDLLPDNDSRQSYYSRIMNFSSHSSLANETSIYLTDAEKNIVGYLLNDLTNRYNFFKYEEQ